MDAKITVNVYFVYEVLWREKINLALSHIGSLNPLPLDTLPHWRCVSIGDVK